MGAPFFRRRMTASTHATKSDISFCCASVITDTSAASPNCPLHFPMSERAERSFIPAFSVRIGTISSKMILESERGECPEGLLLPSCDCDCEGVGFCLGVCLGFCSSTCLAFAARCNPPLLPDSWRDSMILLALANSSSARLCFQPSLKNRWITGRHFCHSLNSIRAMVESCSSSSGSDSCCQ